MNRNEVKLAGYWPSSFFACLWTETESRFINSNKKKTRPISSQLAKQDWSIKDLLYIKKKPLFSFGRQRVIPGAQDRVMLPARVAYHSERFGSFFQLMELTSHIRSSRTELKKMFGGSVLSGRTA